MKRDDGDGSAAKKKVWARCFGSLEKACFYAHKQRSVLYCAIRGEVYLVAPEGRYARLWGVEVGTEKLRRRG